MVYKDIGEEMLEHAFEGEFWEDENAGKWEIVTIRCNHNRNSELETCL